MRFSERDVLDFAEWSHDRNPLHVDPAVAGRTFFGQCIVHGMRTVIAGLGAARLERRGQGLRLDVEFRGAVPPETSHEVETTPLEDGVTVTVRAGAPAMTLSAAAGAATLSFDTTWLPRARASAALRDVPRDADVAALSRGLEVVGSYATSDVPAEYLHDGHVTPLEARVLALCSYVIGMEMPGLRSLFTRAAVQVATEAGDSTTLLFRAHAARYDAHFRMLDVAVEVADTSGRPVARADLRAYVRFSPAVTDPAALRASLAGAASMAGKTVLVTGGTRGLGAELTAALGVAGSHVFASFHRDAAAQAELAEVLSTHGVSVTFLQGDAGDAAWCREAVDAIVARHGRLDVLVLNASAPPTLLRVGADPSRSAGYVDANLRLVRAPLAAALPALTDAGGTLVCISSSFVQEMPPGFADYVAVKQAAEATVRMAVREAAPLRSVIVRPPRLQTAWNDTPTGVLGAIPPSWVATRLVNRLARGLAPGEVELLDDFPPVKPAAATGPPDVTVAVAATFTADPMLPALRFWFDELALNGEVRFAPYGQVLQSLLDPSSVLSANKRGLNVVLVRVRDWLRELSPDDAASPDARVRHLEATARDLERAVRTHRAQAAAQTLLVFCPSAPDPPHRADEFLQVEQALSASLAGVPGLEVVVASDWHQRYEVTDADVHDEVRDHLAHVPYKNAYLDVLATLVVRHLHRRLSPPRKVVVVDCDNTLWRGVVGEVGPEGVEFDAAHRALHQALVRLTKAGLIVCLCSKNEESDVWRVFDTRPELALPRDQVVAAMINWQPKSQNIRTLAGRLNLGLDSFVFIDDNPVECAEVQASCPEVLTLEWPHDEASALRLLDHAWELDAVAATAEDARRTQLYKEEFKRQELMEGALTFGDFIKGLGLVTDIAPLAPADLKRASQLTQRTNQFNFTTRRRDEAAMQALVAADGHDVFTVRVRDRFGDYGLVGLLIAEAKPGALEVDSFMVSCRVLGRGVEHQMAAEMGRLALTRGLPVVRFLVETTKRNTPARNFLEAIAGEFTSGDEQRLQADIPADVLAALTFQPTAAAVVEEAAEAPAPHAHQAGDADSLRRRERQIRRTAQELSTIAALAVEIEGTPAPAGIPAAGPSPDDVATLVTGAFAAALKLTPEEVTARDKLEALGCDSFKIVEITVALLEEFPALPTTLLFEHPSVAEIIEQIRGLSAPPARTPVERATSAAAASDEIAVVGMHARVAGAASLDALWQMLSAGQVAVRPVPRERPQFVGRLTDERPHWAGLLEDADRFDAELFGISPREAVFMDPQLRVFLEVGWAALEDAGIFGDEAEADTGVFAGVMYADYVHHANAATRGGTSPYRSWEGFSLANRLSQVFGFRGPSVAVDTACSSSGTALHIACRALRDGDCRAALVGGVNLIVDPNRFAQLGRLGILSAAGRCLAFGADADGTVLGEGAGAVVLRRLSDALARGDRIYGIVKGTGVSTGSGTVGFTAPNPQAQAIAIRRALKASGVDPRTVAYVEAHGTGTSLGDPIEVRGLTLAYAEPDVRDHRISGDAPPCTIGSIKPNIGHLEAGAAVLSLVKVLLQLQHRELAPSVTSASPNPQIPFAQVPFAIQRDRAPWERRVLDVGGVPTAVPRRAGLSTFGVGGSNAHVILEEAPEAPEDAGAPDRPAHVIALSARTGEQLARRAGEFAAWLEAHSEVSLADAAHSAVIGRRQHEHRLAVVAQDREQALDALGRGASGEDVPAVVRGRAPRSGGGPKVGFLFTGQGAQYAGMGRQLYDAHPVFRDAVDRCAAIVDPLLASPLRPHLFAEPGSESAERLNQTAFTQPSLFVVQYALAELWASWGIRPAMVLGHSVGEFAAMCAAGALSLHDALTLVAARGRLMQALPAGGRMTSVMAGEGQVLAAIAGFEDRLAIAGVNAPNQIVISGAGDAVAEVEARLAAAGVRTKPLVVSHAFHSPLMQPMLQDFRALADGARFSAPQTAFVSTVSGRVANAEVVTPDYWVRQVMAPVRFADAVRTMADEGVTAFVEIGPHPVLLGMGRQCVDEPDAAVWLPSLRRDADDWHTLLGSVGRIWCGGAPVDWQAFDAPFARRRVTVPAYPFGGRRYWIDAEAVPRADTAAVAAPEERKKGPRLYEIAWREVPRPPRAEPGGARWLLLADQCGTGARLAAALRGRGADAILVKAGDRFSEDEDGMTVDPTVPGALEHLVEHVTAGGPLTGIVRLWGAGCPVAGPMDERTFTEHRRLGVDSVLHLVRAMLTRDASKPRLFVVTRGAQSVEREAVGSVVAAALWGLGRTVALEHPEIWGGLIDLPADSWLDDAQAVSDEILSGDNEDQVAYRNGRRFAARLTEAQHVVEVPPSLSPAATYLVTGGLGALGLRVARWLVDRGARRLVLSSRHAPATPAQRAALETLEAAGARVLVECGDVSQRDDAARVIARADEAGAPLRGIVHAAGVDTTVPLHDLDDDALDAVFRPKARGAQLLDELSRGRDLDLFVCFSSLASVLGSTGRAHYAAANAVADAVAADRRAHGLRALAVNWGPWKGGGMASEASLREFERIGNHGLAPDDALRLLDVALSGGPQVTIGDIDWDTFRTVYESRRRRPLLSELGDTSNAGGPPVSPRAAGAPWVERLAAVPPPEREAALAALVRGEVARALGFSQPGDLDAERSFYDQGMDSLVAAELAGRLKQQVGFSCTGPLFDNPAVNALTRALLARITLPAGVGTAAAATPAHGTPAAGAAWQVALSAADPSKRLETLGALLRAEAARTLGFDGPDQVPADANLFDLGMDSLSAAELASRIQKNLGITSRGVVFQHPRVGQLTEALLAQVDLASAAPAEAVEAVAVASAPQPDGVVGYAPALEPAIFEFQRTAWARRAPALIEPRWRWMFVESARRLGVEPRVWLYRDDGRIVGHNGAIPVKLLAAGREHDTAWLVDTMVLEEYRSQAVGSRLMVHAHEDLPLALSLGQTETMRAIQLRLGWHQVAPLETAQFLVNPGKVLKGKLPGPLSAVAGIGLRAAAAVRGARGGAALDVEAVDRFGRAHDELWQRTARTLSCAVVRDASYLNWKYAEQPGQDFLRLELRRGRELVGVAVWMFREPNRAYAYRRGHLVDLVTPLDDHAQLVGVLRAACGAAAARDADALICFHVNPRLTKALRDAGFLLREPQRHLLVDPGRFQGAERATLLDPSSWFVTQGDSDIDRPW